MPIYIIGLKYTKNNQKFCQNVVSKIKCHNLDITSYYGLTSAITQYGKWVSNIIRHTFSHTPFWL